MVNARKKTFKERAEYKRHGQTTEVLTSEELNRNNPAFLEQSLGVMAGGQDGKKKQNCGARNCFFGEWKEAKIHK